MIDDSYTPLAWVLGVLSIFVAIVTNIWRGGHQGLSRGFFGIFGAGEKLSGRTANVRAISIRASIVGIALAGFLHVNIFDMLKNPSNPAVFFDWDNWLFCVDFEGPDAPGWMDETICSRKKWVEPGETVYQAGKPALVGERTPMNVTLDYSWRRFLYEIVGVIVAGVTLGFLSRVWNDLFEIVNAIKYWLRRKAEIP